MCVYSACPGRETNRPDGYLCPLRVARDYASFVLATAILSKSVEPAIYNYGRFVEHLHIIQHMNSFFFFARRRFPNNKRSIELSFSFSFSIQK